MSTNLVSVKYDWKIWLKVVIMLAIMLIIGNLQPFGQITPMGMKVLGVLCGTIFAWIAIDVLWPSLFGFIALGMTGYTGVLSGIASSMSNATVVMILFSATFAGLISKTNCVTVINK